MTAELFFGLPARKPVDVNIKSKQCSHGCKSISFRCHCVLEGDRIPFLKSHGQALKQERCLPGLFCDTGDAPANYYYYYYY